MPVNSLIARKVHTQRIDMEQGDLAFKSACNLDPIFILGARPRSGTNFLRNLLVLHPAIGNGRVVWEDFLLSDSDLLIEYAQRTFDRWPQHWEVQGTVGSWEILCEHIGSGLLSFLNECAEKKGFGRIGSNVKIPERVRMLITKTPTVKNIHNFFTFFPNAHLIVIVRDGRSVVESGVRTFGWRYAKAMKAWNEEVQTIIQFKERIQKEGLDHNLLVVRFEDLFSHTKRELQRTFSFLGVSAEEYNFLAAENLPVSGSSTMASKEGKKVNWEFEEKSRNFNPLERYQLWSRAKHERFNWLVRDESFDYFGYKKKEYGTYRQFWDFWNVCSDILGKTKISIRSIIDRKTGNS